MKYFYLLLLLFSTNVFSGEVSPVAFKKFMTVDYRVNVDGSADVVVSVSIENLSDKEFTFDHSKHNMVKVEKIDQSRFNKDKTGYYLHSEKTEDATLTFHPYYYKSTAKHEIIYANIISPKSNSVFNYYFKVNDIDSVYHITFSTTKESVYDQNNKPLNFTLFLSKFLMIKDTNNHKKMIGFVENF